MATHSSVLAWRIPGTGEPGGLLSLGSQSRTLLKLLSSSIAKYIYLPSFTIYLEEVGKKSMKLEVQCFEGLPWKRRCGRVDGEVASPVGHW